MMMSKTLLATTFLALVSSVCAFPGPATAMAAIHAIGGRDYIFGNAEFSESEKDGLFVSIQGTFASLEGGSLYLRIGGPCHNITSGDEGGIYIGDIAPNEKRVYVIDSAVTVFRKKTMIGESIALHAPSYGAIGCGTITPIT